MFGKFSQWFDPSPPRKGSQPPAGQVCDHPGCEDKGIYRAPKSRDHLESGTDDWHWFCLAHIRGYNARWNYYAHMPEAQIEQERRADMIGQRPSWPLGVRGGVRGVFVNHAQQAAYVGKLFQDPFGLFQSEAAPLAQAGFPPQSMEGKALAVFGLGYPFSQSDLRKRYWALVKKHHPDANKGSPDAEEAIKRINDAYGVLKKLG